MDAFGMKSLPISLIDIHIHTFCRSCPARCGRHWTTEYQLVWQLFIFMQIMHCQEIPRCGRHWISSRVVVIRCATSVRSCIKSVFLVTTANAILPVDRDHSVNTDSWISIVPWGSVWHECVSPWMVRASEQSKRAECCGVSIWAVRATKVIVLARP